jgi:hypothetical protein
MALTKETLRNVAIGRAMHAAGLKKPVYGEAAKEWAEANAKLVDAAVALLTEESELLGC